MKKPYKVIAVTTYQIRQEGTYETVMTNLISELEAEKFCGALNTAIDKEIAKIVPTSLV